MPGTIKAADFDNGGEGIAYHDDAPGNSSTSSYRVSDVDMYEDTVYRLAAGEWIEYTIEVPVAGGYTLVAEVGSGTSGGSFHVELDGVNVTGPLTFPTTGGWNVFATVAKTGVSLTAGKKVMRIVIDSDAGRSDAGSFDTITIQP